jgi:UDP-GlcNAc:undecaprenyl-phosphate/decaprenyl-phosphate GlcNAc-1-phosphate transferase
MRTYVIAFAMSLLLSLILTRLLRDWAIKRNLVDDIGTRKIHKQPIPRLGGIAILLSLLSPLLALSLWDNRISQALINDSTLIISLIGGLSVITVVGLIDDLKGIPAIIKLGAQVTAALVAYTAGVQIEVISIPFVGLFDIGILSFPITIFWFVLVINAINLIDGMDGLAGSVVALAGGTLFVMCLIEDKGVACLILISMLGGVFGFLRYNLNPASIFLGDTGSMALGFMLALVSVHFSQKSSTVFSLVASMLILGLPIFDLVMAVFRRLLSGKRIFSADQFHIHHILLRKGYSQRQSVIVLVGFAILLEAFALIYIYSGETIDALVIAAVVLTLAISVRLLGYNKIIFNQRRNNLMERIETEGDQAFAFVISFRENVMSKNVDWKKELQVAMLHLHWKRVRITCDLQEVFSLTDSSFQQSVHVEGLIQLNISLSNGLDMNVWILEESGYFLPLDKSLAVMIADCLYPHLLQDPMVQKKSVHSLSQ